MSQCPTCNKEIQWQENPYRPFCSERCKLVDLGKWVSEEYRVPGKPGSEQPLEDDEEVTDE
ncbi:MAG TPA: DNA gyrase inhibitor YacG [Pyrinomonadaceae bacterium]|nr:DNA gyrase inhibitor YacG [Pyrinomonadaceae bacterium]